MHYYQHHIGDFIKDTSFLTNEEVGIYLKLIWLYYDTEQPLPNDLNLLATKVNAKANENAVALLLKLYFVLQNDKWHHTRCDLEISEFNSFCAKQKANGAKGGRPKLTQDKPTALPPLTQTEPKITLTTTHNPLPTTHIKTNTVAPKVAIPLGVSEAVWNDYLILRKTKKMAVTATALKGIAREAAKANKPLEEVLAICCERGWGGFKAEWLDSKETTKTGGQEWRTNDGAMLAKAAELNLHTVGLQRFEIVNKIADTLRSRGL
jgi:uncharacterized protein YdaU (DUF1376 family)